METKLEKKLERLRCRLIMLFEEKGTFLDPHVLALSEQIDLLVNCKQREMLKNAAILPNDYR